MMVFAQIAAFYTAWAVHQPIAFLQLWSLTKHFKPVTEELWLHLWHHFLHLYTAHKSLSNEMCSRLL